MFFPVMLCRRVMCALEDYCLKVLVYVVLNILASIPNSLNQPK